MKPINTHWIKQNVTPAPTPGSLPSQGQASQGQASQGVNCIRNPFLCYDFSGFPFSREWQIWSIFIFIWLSNPYDNWI